MTFSGLVHLGSFDQNLVALVVGYPLLAISEGIWNSKVMTVLNLTLINKDAFGQTLLYGAAMWLLFTWSSAKTIYRFIRSAAYMLMICTLTNCKVQSPSRLLG